MKKALVNLIVIIYIIVAIAVTICLLSYNEYKVSEFGDKTLVIMDETNKDLPEFQKDDLIIAQEDVSFQVTTTENQKNAGIARILHGIRFLRFMWLAGGRRWRRQSRDCR